MSNGIKIWCFLLLLPFFGAAGHDIYANYFSTPEKKAEFEALAIDPADYQVSDLGYILLTYQPELYETAKQTVGEDNWVKRVDPVLQLPSMVATLIPFGIFLGWLLIARILSIWPFNRGTSIFKSKRGIEMDDNITKHSSSGKKFDFKRR